MTETFFWAWPEIGVGGATETQWAENQAQGRERGWSPWEGGSEPLPTI